MGKTAAVYVHGLGGSASEADHYRNLLKGYDVIGFDYVSNYPWEAKREFPEFFEALRERYDSVILIANSIGAFYSIYSLDEKTVDKAFFISPIVDMEELILGMMKMENVTEKELSEKKEIKTSSGRTLSWDYLSYVRENEPEWSVRTEILYGEKDSFTTYEIMKEFAGRTGAGLTVMKGGEHWFHTKGQMAFLDEWIGYEI